MSYFIHSFILGQEVTSPSSSIQSPLPTNLSCDGQLLHVDSCIKRAILFGDREALIPTTVQELESSHCERVKGELICIRSFGTTCLKLFPKTIFGLIRKNVEKVYKQLCRTQAGKESKYSIHFIAFRFHVFALFNLIFSFHPLRSHSTF